MDTDARASHCKGSEVTRYAELSAELKKLCEQANEMNYSVDPTHALDRVVALEKLVASLIWLNAQMLKQLEADAAAALGEVK